MINFHWIIDNLSELCPSIIVSSFSLVQYERVVCERIWIAYTNLSFEQGSIIFPRNSTWEGISLAFDLFREEDLVAVCCMSTIDFQFVPNPINSWLMLWNNWTENLFKFSIKTWLHNFFPFLLSSSLTLFSIQSLFHSALFSMSIRSTLISSCSALDPPWKLENVAGERNCIVQKKYLSFTYNKKVIIWNFRATTHIQWMREIRRFHENNYPILKSNCSIKEAKKLFAHSIGWMKKTRIFLKSIKSNQTHHHELHKLKSNYCLREVDQQILQHPVRMPLNIQTKIE